MKKVKTLLVLIFISCITFAQTVAIGKQVWMHKNLNVNCFRNGDLIPEVKSVEEWKRYGKECKPAWCYYKNDPSNGATYGRLYNWYAVNDPRGLAPLGWHIPTDGEWTTLTNFLGGEDVAGGKLKSTSGWLENGNGTNNSGFTGVPGGQRLPNGEFNPIGHFGTWWSSTEVNTNTARYRYLLFNSGEVNRFYNLKAFGFSVRCLRD